MQALGLNIAGFTEAHQVRTRPKTNLDHFHLNYGITPASNANLLVDLQTTNVKQQRYSN
jgi:hypothetical protein